EFEGAAGEGEVDGDADDFGEWAARGRPIEQVLVPIFDAPVGRGCSGGGGEDVLTETRVGILGVEGVDEQGVTRLDGTAGAGVESGRGRHFSGEEAAAYSSHAN